jgi:hypothetical protein
VGPVCADAGSVVVVLSNQLDDIGGMARPLVEAALAASLVDRTRPRRRVGAGNVSERSAPARPLVFA